MNPTTGTYGTKGLPYFGSNAIDFSNRQGAINETEIAFNNLMATVKRFTVPGNETVLHAFGIALEQSWGLGLKAVAGIPVVNA